MDESMITRVQKGEDRVVVIMDRRARGGARRSRRLARCSALSSVKATAFVMINRV